MSTVAVMHVIDTLVIGGAEQVAVNLVNELPRSRYLTHLCTTRADGALEPFVRQDVHRLRLRRRWRWDAAAAARLVAYVRQHDIRLVHGHSGGIFAAVIASLAPRRPVVVMHDHYGRALAARSAWPYRAIRSRVDHVLAVSEPLAAWARSRVGFEPERISFLPNFVVSPRAGISTPALPGAPGRRIVCVANFRRQKDQLTLVHAFASVVQSIPDAHLLLVGARSDPDWYQEVRREIAARGLDAQITILPDRPDVPGILQGCDVGVLSSTAEGLPLALLEYGTAGLAAVATDVGQCSDVLDGGRAGLLVPPRRPDALASAMMQVLTDLPRRADLATRLRQRVRTQFGAEHALETIDTLYQRLLARRPRA